MDENIKSASGTKEQGADKKYPRNTHGKNYKNYKNDSRKKKRQLPPADSADVSERASGNSRKSADATFEKNQKRGDPRRDGGQPSDRGNGSNKRDASPRGGKGNGGRNQKRGARPQIHDGFDDIKMNPKYVVVDDYDDRDDFEAKRDTDIPDENVNPGVIAGRNAVRELLRSGRTVDKIYVKSGAREGSVVVITAEAISRGIPVIEVDQHKLDRICGRENHQGVVAMAAEKDYVTVDDILDIAKRRGEAPLILIADGIEDPHNLGALIRCAECAGVHGIIIPKRRAVGLTPAVAKCSAGAIEHVAVAKVSSIPATIDALKRAGVWIFAAEAGGSAYYDADFSLPAAIIFGSEGDGVGRLAKEKSDFLVSIPMYGLVNSLNVSTAASVILCHAARVRHTMD